MPIVTKETQYIEVLGAAKLRALGYSTEEKKRVGNAVFELGPVNVYHQPTAGAVFEMTQTNHDENGDRFEQWILVLEVAIFVAKVNLLFFLAAQRVLPNSNKKNFRELVRKSPVAKQLQIPFAKLFPNYNWEPMRDAALKLKEALLGPSKSKERKIRTIMHRFVGTPLYNQYLFPDLNGTFVLYGFLVRLALLHVAQRSWNSLHTFFSH